MAMAAVNKMTAMQQTNLNLATASARKNSWRCPGQGAGRAKRA